MSVNLAKANVRGTMDTFLRNTSTSALESTLDILDIGNADAELIDSELYVRRNFPTMGYLYNAVRILGPKLPIIPLDTDGNTVRL